MPKIHDLKILPTYFDDVAKGRNLLLLREWENGTYTGRRVVVKVTYILKGFDGLKDGWVILSIKRVKGGLK